MQLLSDNLSQFENLISYLFLCYFISKSLLYFYESDIKVAGGGSGVVIHINNTICHEFGVGSPKKSTMFVFHAL